ncbi:MAG: CPBP family intramembrane metalloprotease [Candidatus Omnitrophica bacterium]|nr:CPBP family intramembrane metalloprotease [Candidatus Omnitrophota bacterium]
MECPYCGKTISDTAIRCRYCKKILEGYAKEKDSLPAEVASSFLRVLKKILFKGRDRKGCPWNMLDVLALTVLVVLFAANDPFHIGSSIVGFVRAHVGIVTKDPKLLYYISTYINTLILKGASLVFLVVLVNSRNVSFWDSVVARKPNPELWEAWLPLYIGISILIREVNMTNPLVPNLPFNSVFPEARLAGNVVIVLAVLFVAPFVEEVVFRGFLYPAFNKYMGIFPSVVLTSVVFTFAHYSQVRESYTFMVALFSLSIIITYVRAKTGSTWIAIIMHHVYNLVTVGMGFLDYFLLKY